MHLGARGPLLPRPPGRRPARPRGGRGRPTSRVQRTPSHFWVSGASADLDVGADGRGHGCDVGPLGDSYLDLGASDLDLGASILKFGVPIADLGASILKFVVSIPDLGDSDLHLGASGP